MNGCGCGARRPLEIPILGLLVAFWRLGSRPPSLSTHSKLGSTDKVFFLFNDIILSYIPYFASLEEVGGCATAS